jgi:hypothetical protein
LRNSGGRLSMNIFSVVVFSAGTVLRVMRNSEPGCSRPQAIISATPALDLPEP